MKSSLSTDTRTRARTHAPAGTGNVSNPDSRLLSINLLPLNARSPSAEEQRRRGRAPRHDDHEHENIKSNIPPAADGENRGANGQKRGWEKRANVPKRRRCCCSLEASEPREETCVSATPAKTEKVSNGGHSAGFCGAARLKPAERSEEIRKKGEMSVAAYVTGSPHIGVGSSVSSTHDSITTTCPVTDTGTTGFIDRKRCSRLTFLLVC